MSKNIEINYKDNAGYEILYPTTIPDQVINLLTDSTKTYIGLETSATPDDAFRSLYLLNVLQGKSAVRITLQNQDGIKLKGVTITSSQFVDAKGNKTQSATTNDDGYIDVFSDAGTTSVSISGYFEIANTNTSWSTPLGEQHEFIWTVTTRNELTVSSSANYKFSKNVVSFDCCCVGGGGGGGSGQYAEDIYSSGGNGGGGGYVTNAFEVTVQNKTYNCVIGSGGDGAGGEGTYGFGDPGGKGGTTSLLIAETIVVSAEGGEGGGGGHTSSQAQGNGPGAVAANTEGRGALPPGAGSGYIFNESSRGVAGGGGGGAGSTRASGQYTQYRNGASPYGANNITEGARGPGGGGVGGNYGDEGDSRSGGGSDGYRGVIYLRWKITA